jgi:hypothetical protein
LAPTVLPSIEEGFVSTSYGKKDLAPIVQLTQHATSTHFLTVVYPYKDDTPNISIDVPQADTMGEPFGNGHREIISVTMTHKDGKQYRDELAFIGQGVQNNPVPALTHAQQVHVSRSDHAGRALFQYQA